MPGESKTVSSNFTIEGNMITDNKTVTESFSKFFLGTVGRLVDTMNKAVEFFTGQTHVTSAVGIRRTTSTFLFEEISEQFIFTHLRKLRTSKAVGLDQMPSHLMKDSARVISKPLTYKFIDLARLCTTRVKALFKGGKKTEMDNYRPIYILPMGSKILERAIHTQFCRFLSRTTFSVLRNADFERATLQEHAVIALTDHIRRSMDQGMLTGSVFIDLRKAFDTVDHCLLMEKLQGYGVNNKELDWFSDYLQNREQFVQFGSAFSEPGSASVGVPQGSILGPLLFVLFIYDLPNTTVRCNILMYADDTVLFFSVKEVGDIERVLNMELKLIHIWLQKNKLLLNIIKTEVVILELDLS